MAARIDTTTERFERISGSVLDMNAAYTMMGWFYFTTLPTSRASTQFSLSNGANNVNEDYIQIDNGATHHLEFGESIAGSFSFSGGSVVISTGTWYHITLVRGSTTSLQAYVNGVADGSAVTTSVGARTGSNNSYVGDEGGGGSCMDGRIAYVKFWNRALSAAEILDEMRTIRPVHPLNLWGWWPLWPNQRAKDISGNSRDWTEIGTLSDEDPPNTPYGAPEWFIIPFPTAGGVAAVSSPPFQNHRRFAYSRIMRG